jgi:ABC-2 type transport system ATP-binding protein
MSIETVEQAASSGSAPQEIPAIDVVDIVHSFKGRRALDHVTFQVRPHSLHGFVGPNGAGKTTTLKIICTLLRPQYGEARVFGKDVVEDQKAVRKRIGFMPDHFSTYRQMTVFEYLDFFAAAYGQPYAKRTEVIEQVLSLTDMDKRKDDLISGLSRGMQQRVGLARVLINDPDVLLLDEPASGLDPRARIELMEILKALKGMGKTILMNNLLSHTEEHPTYRLTICGEARSDVEERLRGLPGVVKVERVQDRPEYRISYDWTSTTTNQLLGGILELNVSVQGFTEDRRHLNDAFMDLTSRGVR